MNILIIGLGSMGKRRIRNLQILKKNNLFGFDIRKDRCEEVQKKYHIKTFNDFEKAIESVNYDTFIISTPPNLHMKYATYAFNNNIHAFIEASVTDAKKILVLSQQLLSKNILIAPSCTMRYFPFVKDITKLLSQNTIGKVLNINYHVGQYLPDWHPWEDINEYYVSNYETGAAREIVPFELTWINELLGNPKPIICVKKKLTNLDTQIDDIYHSVLEYPKGTLLNLTVEVISRPEATRELTIIGENGKITYSQKYNTLEYINTSTNKWVSKSYIVNNKEQGYIYSEEPYIEELGDFINSIKLVESNKESQYYNTLKKDYDILQLLYSLEKLNKA